MVAYIPSQARSTLAIFQPGRHIIKQRGCVFGSVADVLMHDIFTVGYSGMKRVDLKEYKVGVIGSTVLADIQSGIFASVVLLSPT